MLAQWFLENQKIKAWQEQLEVRVLHRQIKNLLASVLLVNSVGKSIHRGVG